MLLFSGDQCSYIIKHATVVVVFYFGGPEELEAFDFFLLFVRHCSITFFRLNCPGEKKERTKAVEN